MVHDKRYKIIPSVYLILVRDGCVLLGQRQNTGFEDGNYGLGAAGHAEEGETLREAMIRETREEASIELNHDALEHVLTMHRWCGDHQRADFFFTVSEFTGEPCVAEPDKCSDMNWFNLDELPENTIAHIRHALSCYKDGVVYTEFGWP